MTGAKLFGVTLMALAGFLSPQRGEACQCPRPRVPSSINEGVGATCSLAESDAVQKAYQEAEANCAFGPAEGSCGDFALVVTTPCYFDFATYTYKVEGYIN